MQKRKGEKWVQRGPVSGSFRIADIVYSKKMGLKRSSESKKWYIKFVAVESLREQKVSISQKKSGKQSAFYLLLSMIHSMIQ